MVIIIVYEGKTPVNTDIECIGVTGDHLNHTQNFYIKGITEKNIDYKIYLRFSDGSVNTVTPHASIVDDEGVKLYWRVGKTDIRCHGFFDVQIEAKKAGGVIFQTEIVRMYADESIPAESGWDGGGNTVIVSLRDEIENLLTQMTAQQELIDSNAELIIKTGDSKLNDGIGSVSTYNIADGSVTEAKLDSAVSEKLDRVIAVEADLASSKESFGDRISALESTIGTLNTRLESALSGGV